MLFVNIIIYQALSSMVAPRVSGDSNVLRERSHGKTKQVFTGGESTRSADGL